MEKLPVLILSGRYPSAYDVDSTSVEESVARMNEKVNEVVDGVNHIDITIGDILTGWLGDGTLEDIIISSLFHQFTSYTESTLTLLTERMDIR